MAELVDQLEALEVRACSPDGRVWAAAGAGGRLVDVWFERGAYVRYGEVGLAGQLAGLASLLFVRYQRVKAEVVDAAAGPPMVDGVFDGWPEWRRYERRLVELVAEGADGDGVIRLCTRGLASWGCVIADGALSRLREQEFADGVCQAAARVLAEFRVQVLLLKDDIFDVGYPPALREAMGYGRRGEVWGG